MRNGPKATLVLLVIIPILVVVLACGGTTGQVASGTVGATATSAPAVTYKVGDVVSVQNLWEVTINSVKTNPGKGFDKPDAGKVYLVIDISAHNISGEDRTWSSLGMLSLRDATGQKYTEDIVTFATPPDGTVPKGSKTRGQVVYQVPTDQHTFTLTFQPDLLSSGVVVWNLSV